MSEIEAEIDDAVVALGIDAGEWLKLPSSQALKIYQAAKGRFVVGSPRSWWLSLRSQPVSRHEFRDSDGCKFIQALVPPSNERSWFIPETEEAELPVYDIRISDLPRVLGRCQLFEYYLVGKNLDWLVVENDHNEVLVVTAKTSDGTG